MRSRVLATEAPSVDPAQVETRHETSTARRHRPEAKNSQFTNLAIVVIFGLGAGLHINVGGELYLSEALAVVCLPFLVFGAKESSRKRFGWTLVAVALWIAGIVISAYANDARPSQIVTPLVAAAVLAATVVFLLSVVRDPRAIVALAASLSGGLLLGVILQPVYYFSEAPWKFGYALPASLLIATIAYMVPGQFLRIAILLAGAVVNVLGDFRSMALILAATAAIDVVRVLVLSRMKPHRSDVFKGVVILVLVGTVGVGIAAAYSYSVTSGILGEASAERLRSQGGGSPVEMLLAGRYEIFYSLPAALDRPIVGYGPNPSVDSAVVARSKDALASRGLALDGRTEIDGGDIPIHSTVMSAWITAGALGLVAWLAFGGSVLKALVTEASSSRRWLLPGFILMLGVWNMLYSPFGGTNRMMIAVAIVVAICIRSGWDAPGPKASEVSRA